MGQLAGVIGKLKRLKGSLSVRPFYITHLEKWQERAKRIAVALLQNVKPVSTDPEVWRKRIEAESERLFGLLFFSEEEVGAIIGIGIRPMGISPDDPKNYSAENISIDEIERWVAAGRSKSSADAPGKNLDERDDDKSDLQIAWRILYSIKLHKNGWEHLLRHIQEFLGSSEAETASGFYGEILAAWVEQLGPEIIEDFRAWFRGQVAKAIF